MTYNELDILTHPDKWLLGDKLPVLRRGRNIVYEKDPNIVLKPWAGMVMSNNLCRVWQGVFIEKDADPTKGVPIEYETPEELLKQWAID
jgi:hypothetical protein